MVTVVPTFSKLDMWIPYLEPYRWCSILYTVFISMHNVEETDIFRPAAWNAFGMDKEGQDYRACAAYGPMYRNIR